MKVYGYVQGSDDETPTQMQEVTVSADPATLRRMAEWLLYVAAEIEKHGERFGHDHFERFIGDKKPSCRFVVVRDRSVAIT
jgi:hypothetical protein